MICKGTTHNNGAKLARYMTTGKEGELAELSQLIGFAAGDIRDAFRSVHVMADATRCEQPFFHVQVRNPDGEELSRAQWYQVADRIESKLGLTDQPRAIAFHIDEHTGHEHMHVAWSRIDAETMTARPLPFFKERLKEVSREIENRFDLTRVRNEREGPILAPSRDEFEQARRLGVDAKEVRQAIRDCYERSDCGRSFEAALADKGLILAQGDRRDFVVIDHAGGIHAVGKRILGVSAAEIRNRCGDLSRDQLPTVEQARDFTRVQDGRVQSAKERMPDPYRDDLAWQDALHRAAIEKEKIERQFVDPTAGRGRTPESRFAPPAPQAPPHPQLNRTSPEFWFEDAASEISRDGRLAPDRLKQNVSPVFKDLPEVAKIWEAYNRNQHDPDAFAFALGEEGILLAVASKEDAARSREESTAAKQENRFLPTYKEGQVVAIGPSARIYTLNENTTGQPRQEIERFLTKLDRADLQAIEATQQLMHERAESREAYVQLMGIANPLGRVPRLKLNDRSALQATLKSAQRGVENTVEFTGDVLGFVVPPELMKPLGKVAGEAARVAEGIGDAVTGLFAPTLSPEQKLEGEIASHERKAEAEEYVNLSKFTSAVAQVRQQEDERQTTRQPGRDERDR